MIINSILQARKFITYLGVVFLMPRILFLLLFGILFSCQKIVFIDSSAYSQTPVVYQGLPIVFENSNELRFTARNAEIVSEETEVIITPQEVNKACIVFITDKHDKLIKKKSYMVLPKPIPHIRLSTNRLHTIKQEVISKRLIAEHYFELMNEKQQKLNILTEIISFQYELFDGEELIERATKDNTLLNGKFLYKMEQLNHPRLIFSNIVIQYQDGSEYVIEKFVVPEEQMVLE